MSTPQLIELVCGAAFLLVAIYLVARLLLSRRTAKDRSQPVSAPSEAPESPPSSTPEEAAAPQTPNLALPSESDERTVRVFISSTFRDMQAERDLLVKRVFPELRRRARARGVELLEVDLRWGVTEEQAQRGEVLGICLDEIARRRPYFVGFLAERYGWVPDRFEPELIADQPWLGELAEHSVTEMEIVQGVLKEPRMARRAFFYFRDPAYVYNKSIPDEERPNYLSESEQAKTRLEALKQTIRDAHVPVVENYPDPESVVERVQADLWAAIDQEFPEGSQPDSRQREAREHDAFALRHVRAYVPRPALFAALDRHVAGDGPPLVVLGEPGAGKSALLANWALGYRQAHPSELMLLHFIGSSLKSTDWAAMVRRIMGDLQRWFNIAGDIPDEPDALRADFASWLQSAAQRGRCVLVLDSLNRLEDRDSAPDLAWLPRAIPGPIRLIVATAAGPSQVELARRGWPVLRLEPLAPAERRQLIVTYLAAYRKALAPDRVERIVAAPSASSPLFLRALLGELRIFGIHERLDERIGHYLAADSADTLYARILERYEQDYERDRTGLVREAMSLLWAARGGLSESELLELLGESGRPLPYLVWSPLYLAAEDALASREDLLNLHHSYLDTAVRNRYLPDELARRSAHLRLADYFAARPVDDRQVEELPWHLAAVRDWQRLYDLLCKPDFFAAAWQTDAFAVKAYWAQVEANSALRMVTGYKQVLDRPESCDPDVVWALGFLFEDMGYSAVAAALRAQAAEQSGKRGDRVSQTRALINQALSLWHSGEKDQALAILNDLDELCRLYEDKDGLQQTLGLKALIYQAYDQLDLALTLLRQQADLCRALGDKAGLSVSLGNQAVNLQKRNRPQEALELHLEEAALCRELGDKDGLEASLGNQALALRALGDLDGALVRLEEQEALCRSLGKKRGLHRALGNRAAILHAQGKSQEALALYHEKARLCRELGAGENEGLAIALVNQARILAADLNQPGPALRLAEEAYRLAAGAGYSALAGQVAGVMAAIRGPQS